MVGAVCAAATATACRVVPRSVLLVLVVRVIRVRVLPACMQAHKATVWMARHLPQNRDLFLTAGGNGGLNIYK